jgi:hypothetical protein
MRFRPGGDVGDQRGGTWSVEGDLEVLGAAVEDERFVAPDYPDGLQRLWSALRNPNAADILISLAPGWECVDWGGATHIPGGSHGSLRADDSLGTLLTVGVEGERPERELWAISDVAGIVNGHFGLDDRAGEGVASAVASDDAT